MIPGEIKSIAEVIESIDLQSETDLYDLPEMDNDDLEDGPLY